MWATLPLHLARMAVANTAQLLRFLASAAIAAADGAAALADTLSGRTREATVETDAAVRAAATEAWAPAQPPAPDQGDSARDRSASPAEDGSDEGRASRAGAEEAAAAQDHASVPVGSAGEAATGAVGSAGEAATGAVGSAGEAATEPAAIAGAPGVATQVAERAAEEILGEVAQPPGAGALPVPGWDALSVGSIRARLSRLQVEELVVLRSYEQQHANRLAVVTMLENRIAKLQRSEDVSDGADEGEGAGSPGIPAEPE